MILRFGFDNSAAYCIARFQAQTGCAHAFQVVVDLGYAGCDCFSYAAPVVVPARTLFSQLL